MLRFDRKQQNSVKQLSFNKKKKLILKKRRKHQEKFPELMEVSFKVEGAEGPTENWPD